MTDRTQELGPVIDAAIPFAERFAGSPTFRELFREGMDLVEETAAYLDGDGRAHSKVLSRNASLSYATESMRLTTRLMQLASWLLLQRAVNEGEMTQSQAGAEKAKVRLDGASAAVMAGQPDELPEALRDLITRSLRLQDRIRHLDQAIYTPPESRMPAANPVGRQIGRLADAFSGSAARDRL
ncbi:protease adaptor protein RcdA [Methylobrevis albus]|uniref:DUF1465 family protein n=1 Tax=Methylobrevis albus TaxID=2793297 RepID=A0A931I1C2_9HYPH|nr:DUF1465 family protein [Methylobrevis albus]MBH0237156.1 DUF1465 family protein [Methylobrevis albus]